ncbi:MAG: hypothetical protein JWL97_4409 [Gemmatimonadales bacterium]|nr:hypothetical protein [Gemmatimonadales bacterium]
MRYDPQRLTLVRAAGWLNDDDDLSETEAGVMLSTMLTLAATVVTARLRTTSPTPPSRY